MALRIPPVLSSGTSGDGGLLLQHIVQTVPFGSTTNMVAATGNMVATDGFEIATITVVPSKAGSRLHVRAKVRSRLGNTYNGDHAAIFFGTQRLTQSVMEQQTGSWHVAHVLLHEMVAADTSPITFSLRAGSATTGIYTVEADSWLEVQELAS